MTRLLCTTLTLAACLLAGAAYVVYDVTRSASTPAPVCNMTVDVIGYESICAKGIAPSPSPSTHLCLAVGDEIVCVPLTRAVVRRSL
jgi:hypothetical protein